MNKYERIETVIMAVVTVGFLIFFTWIKLDNSASLLLTLSLFIFILFALLVIRFMGKKRKKHNTKPNDKWIGSLLMMLFIFLYNGLLNIVALDRSFLNGSSWMIPAFIGIFIGLFVRKKSLQQ
ncbi:hypothetical protein ACFCYN_24945 [Gottfriedia sp. NPDC056225]|uniref:hypothetical protein n=1 Tax=Gottfriedia sp. NPDC056225 TaxID=3345751 RepID=UPI0035D5760C